MTAPPSPSTSAIERPARARRRGARALAVVVVLLAVLAASAIVLLQFGRSEAGTRWLLTHVPGLTVTGVQGSLVGDTLRIESLRWQGTAAQPVVQADRIELQQPSWRVLPFAGAWALVAAPALTIDRVTWRSPREPAVSAAPLPPPVRLPFALAIDRLRIGELLIDDQPPWREVHAGLRLGDSGGTEHSVNGLSMHNDRVRLAGDARIGTLAPLPLALQLQATPISGTPWQAQVSAEGPLANFALHATLRSDERKADAPSLDVQARIEPFASWPLAELNLSTRALDLAALISTAPRTRLDVQAQVQTAGLDRPAQASVRVRNHAPGRWDTQRVPLRTLALELTGTPNQLDRLDIRQFDALLADDQRDAGRVQGSGHWAGSELTLKLQLTGVEPARLHGTAPALRVAGPLTLALSGVALPGPGRTATSPPPPWQARIDGTLDGTWAGSGQPVRSELALTVAADMIDLVRARVTSGPALVQATLKAQRRAGTGAREWQIVSQGEVARFDPLPWWPGAAGSVWSRGPHRANGRWSLDLQLPATLADAWQRDRASALASLRGQLDLDVTDSQLAGLPLAARLALRGDGQALAVRTQVNAAGNQASADGQLAAAAPQDRWRVDAALPALAALQPLAALWLPASRWPQAGALRAQAQLDGRWPRIGGTGSLQANGMRIGDVAWTDAQLRGRLTIGSDDAPIDLTLTGKGLQRGAQRVDDLQARIEGTLRAHRVSVHADSPSRPPAWSENLIGSTAGGTRLTLQSRGGWIAAAEGGGTWHAEEAALRVGARDGNGAAWVDAKGINADIAVGANGALRHAQIAPGRALLPGGAALRWTEAAWHADGQRIDLRSELEPLAVAPLLARLQPELGWGGDLTLAGRIDVHAAERFDAEIVLARAGGDLRIADESGTPQALGVEEVRLAFAAHEGVWQFAQGVAGRQVGEMAGAQVVRTHARARWPAADAALEGVLQMRVANLGAWGMWVPPGWRLGGNLRVSAAVGGRFGAPELRGDMQGADLSVRNVLLGIGLHDGELSASLDGISARVQRLAFKGGDGTLQLRGDATLGATPSARLRLDAERFRLLGRIDRRIITSGGADLQLQRDAVRLDGRFRVDEGLIDFSRGGAPDLDGDVTVVRGGGADAAGGAATRDQRGAMPILTGPLRNAQVNLAIDLGEKLQVRGRGLDASLRGDLRVTTPGGRLAVNGSVRTAGGTYIAYAQKMVVERGELTYTGAADNPRLDIIAVRPNLDVRVGVAVTGQLSNPRVRLFSEPDMGEMDKLSWLVLGRASEGLGRNDTALLQRAALALLAGEEQGPTDQLLNQLGLTDFSLRQSEGEVRETIVSLGRQLSQRWYVGYERSVNATTGTWQLVYRIAQRFTLRAQSGVENSLDLIWSWRW